MKNTRPSTSTLLRGSLLLAGLFLFCFAAAPVYSAGTEPSTSAYATIQPNLAGTGYVYTISYVAGEDHISTGPRSFEGGPFGNGGATLDNVNIMSDSTWSQLSLDGFSHNQTVRYASSFNNSLAPFHTQHVTSLPNTTSTVQWADPMTATNTALGYQSPTVATPQFNDVGAYTPMDTLVYGSGIQGVTGIFGTNPSGAGATVGVGVGIQTDLDGGLLDDLAFMVAGYNASSLAVKTNPLPRTGYLRVEVPYPSQVETSQVKLTLAGTPQVETLTLAGNAGTPQVETATIAGTISGASTKQVETLTLSGTVTGVAGAAQVETATIAGTITGTAQVETLSLSGTATSLGTIDIRVTAVGMTNSPKTIPVNINNGNTAATQAALVVTALNEDPDVSAFFNVTGSTTVILTAKTVAANDGTMNVESLVGTATGTVAVTLSANTTAGVAPGAGNIDITVTGALIAGSPLVVPVAVGNGRTAIQMGGDVRTALTLVTAITNIYTVGGTNATVSLTKKSPFITGDGTLNIASATGTATGLTAAASSADTTAGVAGGAAAGTLNIRVTAAGMTNSPKTIPVNVFAGDSTATQALRAVTALNFDPDIGTFFTASGTTTVILTAKTAAANDGAMNVESLVGTATGPVAVATSGNTTSGALTGAGNVLITVTGALINGGVALPVNVAVDGADTATLVAGKVRTALGAITDITEDYAVGGTTITVTLTKKPPITANDATLNIASANGTTTGLTAAPTSANTTSGAVGGAGGSSGTLNIIVTAVGMTGTPKTVPVAILDGDPLATQAARAANALNADPDVGAFFAASYSGTAALVLTARKPAFNDGTMNVASSPVTAFGPTAVASSTNTTAGQTTSVSAVGGGIAVITVTGALIVGSPLAVNAAVATGDTAAIVATKFAAALNAVPAITANYTASSSGDFLALTKTTAPTFANDTTLNIAYANGTASGLTTGATAVTSSNTSGGSNPFTERFIVGTHTNNPAIELTVTTNASYVPKIAVSGDFDSDRDVDATDLASAAAGYTGVGSGLGRWYRNGDTNSDNDVDNADLGYVIGAFAATPGTPPAASGSSTLTYDPANGNVKLNAATAGGAKITSFQLQTSAGTFVPGSYTGPAFGGTKQQVTTSVIGNTDTTLAGATGSAIDLGNIFPTLMTLPQLTSYLTTKVYTGGSGTRQQDFTLALAVTATPFETWIALYPSLTGGDALITADPENDGLNNGLEFGTNGNPTSGAANPKVVGKIGTVGGAQVYTLTLPVRNGAIFSGPGDLVSATVDGIVYTIQATTDLSGFTALTVTEVTGGDATTIQSGIPAPSAGWTLRTFRHPTTVNVDPKGFLRAKVTATP